MSTNQLPKVLGVVRVDEVAQLMDHHIVSNGVGCLDDVPVKNTCPFLSQDPQRDLKFRTLIAESDTPICWA